MSDVDVLSAKLEADVGSFVANMKRAEDATTSVTEHLTKVAGASHEASAAHEENAGAIGLAVEGYDLAAEAISKVVETLGEFAETAIEAANEMDPAGAIEWTKSVEGLKSSFQTFAGTIGKEIRPAAESLMQTFSGLFDYLSRLDWHAIFQSLLDILAKTGTFVQTWGTKVLDFLSYPFRMLVSIVEQSLAGVMAAIGTVVGKLGDTSIGKKLGLSEFSGDALTKTADDMFKQSEAFKKSFGAAVAEVGTGLSFSLDAALKAVGAGSAVENLKKAALTPRAGNGGEKVETEQQLAAKFNAFMAGLKAEQDHFKDVEQADQKHIAVIRQGAAERKTDAMNAVNDAKQILALAQQKLADDKSGGHLGALAADNEAIAKAMDALTAAGTNATQSAAQSAAEGSALAQNLANRAAEAVEKYNKAREEAVAADAASAAAPTQKVLQLVKTEADARAAMLEAEKNTLVSQAMSAEQAASRERKQSALETGAITKQNAVDVAKIQRDAAKQAADFYAGTFKGLGGRALGSVGGGALAAAQAGFAAAGPMGAAVGAGASLLENSAGFKKFADALNGIFQSLADAAGRLLEPLVPVIQQIGQAIKPLIDALGNLFGVAGRILAATLQPLIPVIQMLAELAAQILAPITALLSAVEPLIPMVVTISEAMLAFSMVGLAPLIAVFEVLRPVIDLLVKGVKVVVDAIASVWNSIIGEIQNVVRGIANILPDKLGGNALNDFANSMDGLKVYTDAAAVAAQGVAEAMTNATNAANSFDNSLNQASQTASNKLQSDEATAAQQWKAYLDFLNQGDSKDAAAALAAYNATEKQANADALAAQVADILRAAGQNGGLDQYDFNGGKTYQQELDAAQLAQTENDIKSTAANTKATQALTATLGNMVSGFRAGTYDQGGGGGLGQLGGQLGGGGPGGFGGLGASGFHIHGDVIVSANDPTSFGKALHKHAAGKRRGGGGGFGP